jgi:hypothetical protein
MSREFAVTVIVYGDFNCFYAYLASQRADRLIRTGAEEIDWRAVEHDRRLPVTGIRSDPDRAGWDREFAEAGALALPGEQLPAAPPPMVSNTRAAVAAYSEAVTDGVEDELRRRLFDAIWAQRRNLSAAYDVRRVITEVTWPADPIYVHLVSPDMPNPLLHDPDLRRIVRRSGGMVTPDGGPLTTAGDRRSRDWRQQWLGLPQQLIPAVISPSGTVHFGADGLRCLAAIAAPAALGGRPAPGLPAGGRAASRGPAASRGRAHRRRPSGR